MKNFILVEAPQTSEAKYLLLHLDPGMPDDAREFKPFTNYTAWLAQRGYSPNTVKLYSVRYGLSAALGIGFDMEPFHD